MHSRTILAMVRKIVRDLINSLYAILGCARNRHQVRMLYDDTELACTHFDAMLIMAVENEKNI